MSSPTSDRNPETLDAPAELRENINYIEKFGLPPSVAQHIDFRLIFNDVQIDDPTIASDIELNSYVLHCLESYQLSQSFVVDYMLEVFREEFHGWGYTEFSKLNQHIREALKETFMAKGIYMGTPSDHINQRLANLVIDEQLPIWDENDLRKYKKMYPTSKAWLFESDFAVPQPHRISKYRGNRPIVTPVNIPVPSLDQSFTKKHPSGIYFLQANDNYLKHAYAVEIAQLPMEQRIALSVEAKIKIMDNIKQQSFTPRPANIISDPANALGQTPPTKAILAQIPPVQAPPTPAHPIQIPTAQVLPIPAATIQAPLSLPLIPSPLAEHGHGQPEMHTEQVKIVSDKLDKFINKHADTQSSASGQKEIQGLHEKDVFKVITPDKVVTPEEVPSSIQVFNSCFVDDIKNLCTDKAYKKSRPVVHAYNDEKKNLVLMHSPKILGVSQGIGSRLAAIIRDNDNDNIRFYLRDITQAYVEIALDLNPDFYIRPLFQLISQLRSTSFDSIVKVMRPLYSEPEADNHRFAMYHPHYKENPGVTKSAHDY